MSRNWKDAYCVSVGFRNQANEDLMLQAGVAYDSSPVDSSDRTADAPTDQQIRLSVGEEYQLKGNMKPSAAVTFIDYGDSKIRRSTLVGDCRNNEPLF